MEVEVRPRLKVRSILLIILVIAAMGTGALMSTENFMRVLPVYKHYRCALCHTSADPVVGSAALNSFGTDFRDNGYKWNATLAAKDSDGDGYPNGVEIGDDNGDGTADISFERSNPGDRYNTPNSVDRQTWGIIKSLFED
jgi:hypothetical protein